VRSCAFDAVAAERRFDCDGGPIRPRAATMSGAAPGAKAPAAAPVDAAGALSRLFFAYLSPIFALGALKPLEEADLPPLPRDEAVRELTRRMNRAWREEAAAAPAGSPVRFGRVLRRVFGRHFWAGGLLKLLNDLLGFCVPIQLNLLLRFLQDENEEDWPAWSGWLLAVGLFVITSLKTVVENQFFYHMSRIALQVQAAVAAVVYNKALLLSTAARNQSTTGEIVNLMQLDAQRLGVLVLQLHVMWSGIFQVCGYLTQLLIFIGPSALGGVFSMPFFIVLQSRLMQRMGALRGRQTRVTDERVKQTNEAIQGIRAIKMYAWEESFAERISKLRGEQELELHRQMNALRSMSFSVINAAPAFILVVTFFFYTVVAGEEMEAARIFTVIVIFDQLRFPLILYPSVLSQYVEAQVSLKRLTNFMSHLEVCPRSELPGDDGAAATFSFTHPERSPLDGGDGTDASRRGAPSYTNVFDAPPRSGGGSEGARGGIAAAVPLELLQRAQSVYPPLPDDSAIFVQNASFKWDKDAKAPVLHAIDLDVKRGALVGVVGLVGSGKTSLCMSLLNELVITEGTVSLRGSVAYVAQSPWILNASVRENVRFGHELDAERYARVLRACALEKDLELLPRGDETEIGERGINLSGGQKQRVSLARATFANADLYILDDPFSALDAEVGRHVFEECVLGVLAGKTRFMVTNQLYLLPRCDRVVVLDTKEVETAPSEKARVGFIRECGTYAELMERGGPFCELMKKHAGAEERKDSETRQSASQKPAKEEDDVLVLGAEEAGEEEEAAEEAAAAGDAPAPAAAVAANGQQQQPQQQQAQQAAEAAARRSGSISRKAAKAAPAKKSAALVVEEERAVGAVKREVYFEYFRSAGSVGLAVFMLVTYVVAQGVGFGSGFWVSHWSERTEREQTSSPDPGIGFYLGIYASFAVMFSLFVFVRMYTMYWVVLRSARSLHDNLLRSVLGARVAFFDTTPVGRIIARFAKDVDQVDSELGIQLNFTIFSLIAVLATMVVIVIITPWFGLVLLPLGLVYVAIMNYYRHTSRELKRLDSITRSPIFAHFSATLGGLPTIRAYRQQPRFIGTSAGAIDRNNRAQFVLKMSDRWLSLRLEVLGSLVVGSAAIFAVMSKDDLYAGLVGLSLSYALSVTGLLGWGVRSFASLENAMNSVERVLHYTHDIEHEAARVVPDSPADSDPTWPARGLVAFERYEVRYRPGLDLVLRGLTLEIAAGEKVGVVGRTGSGKSTLMLALLRIMEAAGGRILIDGVDIARVGLRTLRSRISIIPQDPILFSGSVRFNLDPTGAHSDEQMWIVLDKIGLRRVVETLPGGLDAKVAEYGENFSAGHRQLMCLGRALLRRCRLLLLDEATSSVDAETDHVVQRVIREEFRACTVITVAHRINTIIDSDKILVLGEGRMLEFEHPARLLANPGSAFCALVSHTGKAAAARLRAAADAALRSQQQRK
jgi:ABC-type multidrug transport system fused ATPase/permease subunit